MPRWKAKLYRTDRAKDFEHERDRQVRARQVYETIDRQSFQWIVVLVAGIGFFLDGYTIFASNMALPMIAYVYWNNEVTNQRTMMINIATLAGTMLGQLVFGVLADARGRKKMYGVELIVLLTSTLGVVMSSTGQNHSMSIYGWLVAWRFIAGIGIGADYPLSAIIASELAPTLHRARMMACIFFMQPLGQIASTLVSIIVISITRRSVGDADITRSVDIMWRWIIGIGVVPGVLALIFRLAIPETPRFLLEIKKDRLEADFDTAFSVGTSADEEDLITPIDSGLGHNTDTWTTILDEKYPTTLETVPERPAASIISIPSSTHTFFNDERDLYRTHQNQSPAFTGGDWTQTATPLPTLNSSWSSIRADLYKFFIKERNWITLFATASTWLLIDVGFYGIGLSSPQFLANTWGSLNIQGQAPPWKITDDPSVSPFTQFFNNSIHALVILNAGSFLGGILLILGINRINRVALQRYGFLFLTALFIIIGVVFLADNHVNQTGPVAITLFIIAQTAFNFGPNGTTFILPAELFPTRYRASCHGISAAAGKLGSILVLLISWAMVGTGSHKQDGTTTTTTTIDVDPIAKALAAKSNNETKYAYTMMALGLVMAFGWGASLLLPQVQVRDEVEAHDEKRKSPSISTPHSSREQRHDQSQKQKKSFVSRVWIVLTGQGLRSKTLEELSLGRKGEKSVTASVLRQRGRSERDDGWI